MILLLGLLDTDQDIKQSSGVWLVDIIDIRSLKCYSPPSPISELGSSKAMCPTAALESSPVNTKIESLQSMERKRFPNKVRNHKNEKLLLYFVSLWIKFNKNNLNVARDTLNLHGYQATSPLYFTLERHWGILVLLMRSALYILIWFLKRIYRAGREEALSPK